MMLWHDISEILRTSRNLSTLLIGDFNCVRIEEERENCIYKSIDSIEFSHFIAFNSLIEAPLTNGSFTWFGHSNKKSHLDRTLVNQEWAMKN